jgi:hypothetical protein
MRPLDATGLEASRNRFDALALAGKNKEDVPTIVENGGAALLALSR